MPGPSDWFTDLAHALQAEWAKIGAKEPPREARYAEISSGAPQTTGTGPRPEVTTPMAGQVRVGNGTTLVVDGHGYAPKADEKTREAIRFLRAEK